MASVEEIDITSQETAIGTRRTRANRGRGRPRKKVVITRKTRATRTTRTSYNHDSDDEDDTAEVEEINQSVSDMEVQPDTDLDESTRTDLDESTRVDPDELGRTDIDEDLVGNGMEVGEEQEVEQVVEQEGCYLMDQEFITDTFQEESHTNDVPKDESNGSPTNKVKLEPPEDDQDSSHDSVPLAQIKKEEDDEEMDVAQENVVTAEVLLKVKVEPKVKEELKAKADEAKVKVEELKLKVAEEAKLKAAEEAKLKAAEEAKLKAAEEVKLKAKAKSEEVKAKIEEAKARVEELKAKAKAKAEEMKAKVEEAKAEEMKARAKELKAKAKAEEMKVQLEEEEDDDEDEDSKNGSHGILDGMTVIDEVTEESEEKVVAARPSRKSRSSRPRDQGDDEASFPTDTEMVSEDELPTESKEPLETEAVSDEELPDPSQAVDLPETEAVSEDELPPEKTDKRKRAAKMAKGAGGDAVPKKKVRAGDAQKRKLVEGDTYDPSSPTSENSLDETPAKRPSMASAASAKSPRKSLPELDKYWKAVKDDPTDFTGWTYLLQYVDQENDTDAAREAYDAFLSHYPYCYGYWRKYADYEKRKSNKEKCEEVFDRGLKAIPLSVDLWIHYLNYCKASYSEDEHHLRAQFEKAIASCGIEFRSDRLWESYIKWETEGKRLQLVTALYDRLLATPTQGYTNHFDNFQEHVSSNPPQKVVSVDEFLTLRQEVLQALKQSDQPLVPTEDTVPGEEMEVPPGEETEVQPVVRSDEETSALREKIINIRKKMHKSTAAAVTERWNFEEGIKRPYFHVKPLERCQLKNWKEYLDYEIEQGSETRIVVLFERCLIACALYEEFWVKFVRYLESLDGDMTEKIRNVYDRACLIHHTKKPNLHLLWAVFEESLQNYDKASEILTNLEKLVPNMLQVAYRRINLERRRNDMDQVCSLYEHYVNSSKSKVISNNMAIKYARFCWKVMGDLDRAISILNKAVEKDKSLEGVDIPDPCVQDNPRLYLQLIDMELQKTPLTEGAILAIMDQFLERDNDPEQKVLFAMRKVEFLEDFGSDVLSVQRANDEFQRYLKQSKDRKKKCPDMDGKLNDGSSGKKSKNQLGSDSTLQHSGHSASHTTPPFPQNSTTTSPPQPPSGAQPSTPVAGATQYPPPGYGTSGSYSQQTQGGYQGGQYPSTGPQQPPAPYGQAPYNQQYSQSGDPNYANYQNWGYSQTGYGGYNQGWGNYNYY